MLNTQALFRLLLQPQVALNYSLKQWEDTIFVLREAKLLAALYHSAVRQNCFTEYPEYAKQHLHSAHVYAARQSLQIHYEAAELRQLFEEIGVTALFLKGAAYTLRDSINSQGRVCSDLDVLINKSDISKAEAQLKRNRWKSEELSDYDEQYYRQWAHEIPPLIHLNRGTVVDMHHNLYLPISGRAVEIKEFIATKQKTQSGCFVLDPSATVMHSIIHLFANEDSSSWMRDLYDIALLIQEYQGEQFWQKLISLAKQTDFEFEFVCCVKALDFYTQTRLPDKVTRTTQAYPLTKWQIWLIKYAIIPAIAPEHTSVLTRQHLFAKQIVYLRGHWIKMPPAVLVKHFAIKSFLAIRDKIMGKHHFEPQLPQNPDW